MRMEEEPINMKYLTPSEYFLRIPAGVGRIAGVVCAVIGVGGSLLGQTEGSIELIAGGFTLAYFSDSYIKNTDARAHAREQAELLSEIEKKLK